MKSSKGFTLIELLIVIAILAIIAAIAIIQVTKYRIRANNTASLSDLKNVVAAQEYGASLYNQFLYTRTSGALGDTGIVRLYYKTQPIDSLRLSHNVGVVIKTDSYYSTYCAVTKHKYGDTYYAADPDAKGFFYAKEPDKVGENLRRSDCPKPRRPGEIDFGPGVSGHNWIRY